MYLGLLISCIPVQVEPVDPGVRGSLNKALFVNADVQNVSMICARACFQLYCLYGCCLWLKDMLSFIAFCPRVNSVALHQLTFFACHNSSICAAYELMPCDLCRWLLLCLGMLLLHWSALPQQFQHCLWLLVQEATLTLRSRVVVPLLTSLLR